jgi:MFS family permease
MRRLALLLAAAAAFGLAPLAARLDPVPGAALLFALGVALSLAGSGALSALSAAAGALGALAGAALAPVSPAAAGAALAALAFAERTSRVRGRRARIAHLTVALSGGAVAGAVSGAYASASPGVRGVSLAVAAVLVALPLLVDADDPIAHALDAAAADVSDPAQSALRAGAALRRTADESLLDRRSAAEVRRTWAALARLAEARVRLERACAPGSSGPAVNTSAQAAVVLKRVDDRVAEHVAALTRAYTAVDAARAAEASLDDAALRSVETVGESLEQVSKAIVDEV